MYKAFLLFLCLLALTPTVVGQERIPRRPVPSPVGQPVRPASPVLSKEQMDRLRPIAQAILENQRARAQGTVPTPNQHPSTLSPALNGLGGFLDYTPDPNLLKYGPFGPNVKYGPLGPLGAEHGAQQSPNAGPNSGVVWNLEGFTHPLDRVGQNLGGVKLNLEGLDLKLEGFNERIEASTNGAIEALNKLQQLIEASNQPPVPRTADRKLTGRVTASAASVRSTGPLPSDDTSASKAIAASTRGRRAISPYNSPLPHPNGDRIGNRARNPRTDGRTFPVLPNTELYDARGKSRGEIDDSRVRLNFGGERKIKTPSGKVETAYSTWFVDLDGEKASGLILESDLIDKPQMPSLMPPRPPNEGRTAYRMTGGDPNSAAWGRGGVPFKVNPGYRGGGQSSTDYGLRPDGYVNLCYNVPGTGTGGICYDTFKAGTTFYREKSVRAIEVPLYYPGGDVRQGHLTFVFGTVDTPTGPRRGWVPLQALERK
jgi:hypothetical protein